MLKKYLLVLLFAGPAIGADAERDLRAVRLALEGAERGPLDAGTTQRLADHPLYPWIEYTSLRKSLPTLTPTQVRGFLDRYRGQPVAEALREVWVDELIRRKDWANFRAFYIAPESASDALRCANIAATLAAGAGDEAYWQQVEGVWRTGRSLPLDCDAPFAAAAARARLTPSLRWERIELAATAGAGGVMRVAARGLPAAELALANDYAAFIDTPHERTVAWPRTERSRRIASDGLAKLARRDPDGAETRLARLAPALGMNEAERGKVQYQIALWTVASYLPRAAQRLNAVPESVYDERLHEWRVREALARGDDRAALVALAKMIEPQRSDPRWKYFQARVLERQGQRAAAQAAYAQAAQTATFHGFLAADRIGAPYALCPWEPIIPSDTRRAVENDAGLRRAFALYRIERIGWATREWLAAIEDYDDAHRYAAIELAHTQADWYDRAVFSLGDHADAQRLYRLRFPLQHERSVYEAARRNGLDPAWVAAEIRAESAWTPRARSSADALGLMQLLPSTAAATARRAGVAYGGRETLFDPDVNIMLGTAHLRYELDKHGLPYYAIAAYNAGPTPVARWRSQRPGIDADFWIETVTYKETREYVARVFAFSVIYDWRLGHQALPVSERMLGRRVDDARRRAFVCPTTVQTRPAS